MHVKIKVKFDLENLFDFKEIRKRIKQQFTNWKHNFDLKNLKVEFI